MAKYSFRRSESQGRVRLEPVMFICEVRLSKVTKSDTACIGCDILAGDEHICRCYLVWRIADAERRSAAELYCLCRWFSDAFVDVIEW